MRDVLRGLAATLRGVLGVGRLQATIGAASVEQQRLLYLDQFRAEPYKPLACHSESAFSQNGEDGVIAEIFHRLGTTPTSFVEIGTGDGTENNTVALLLGGARGIWIEADKACADGIRVHQAEALRSGQLILLERRVTAENVNALLREARCPQSLDVLSIDIDGNDYWIWKAIEAVSPKIVAMEYNAGFGSTLSWTKAYDPAFQWNGVDRYYGASLAALEALARQKNYVLIGADFFGVNAFFLRADLLSDAFPGPHTSRAIFQPFRRGLGGPLKGQTPAFGPFVSP